MQVHLVAMTIILVSIIGVMPATYAQEQGFSFAQPDFLFAIATFIENVRLGFAESTGVSQNDRIELMQEFAFDKQKRIDEALLRGETVSLQIEERRLKLITQAESLGAVTQMKLDRVSEYNDIRILYSQFPNCLENCTIAEKQMFNDRVNSLDTWKKKCSGTFDIDNYELTNDSFSKLTLLCPDLADYSKSKLRTAIAGYT